MDNTLNASILYDYNDWVQESNELMAFEEYICYSTILQINDGQIKKFTSPIFGKIGIVNYDLYSVTFPDQNLYGIIAPNECAENLWKLITFLSADMILYNFDIKLHQLPLSSRDMKHFAKQLTEKPHIDADLIETTDWKLVKQNESIKNHFAISAELDNKLWIEICNDSLKSHNLPCIPIVVIKDQYHFIEWVQIIYHKSERVYYNFAVKYIDTTSLVYGYRRERDQMMMNISDDVLNIIIKYCCNMMIWERDISIDDIGRGNKLLGSASGLVLSDKELNKYRRLSDEELCLNEDGSSGFALPPYLIDNMKF